MGKNQISLNGRLSGKTTAIINKLKSEGMEVKVRIINGKRIIEAHIIKKENK